MSSLTLKGLSLLATEITKKHGVVEGYVFSFEYPGFYQYAKGDTSVCFTPDYNTPGEVDIQVFKENGAVCVHSESITYVALNADILVNIVKPTLERTW